MAAILSVKTQECIVGVRPDGLYTMDARQKKQGHLHKDILAEVKYPSGSVIVKQKGEGYMLHVNTCTAIEIDNSISNNSASPWLCSIHAGTMCNDIYVNGDIVGRKVRSSVTSPTGISVKFNSGSVLIEENEHNYVTTTETTFTDNKLLPGDKKSRKRTAAADGHISAKAAKVDNTIPEFTEPQFHYSLEDLLNNIASSANTEREEVTLVPYANPQSD